MNLEFIGGGVCAAQGFSAAGVHCGIRKNKTKKDLALIYSEKRCAAACTYTQNKVKGAPIIVTRQNVANGYAQCIICNSGNANTCNANGIEIATDMCSLIAHKLNFDKSDVIVASTGVIGQPLSIEPIAKGIAPLVSALSTKGSQDACLGIMTTDTKVKEFACRFKLGDKICHVGAIAKGSGMIHPNMATMLCFVTSDVAITPQMLQRATSGVAKDTFNMVSVDGDTSTNDMLSVMANGMAENKIIEDETDDYNAFYSALYEICKKISKAMAKDGEGATKLLECNVTGAPSIDTAKKAAKSVICSSLLKAAMFGADANWGRVLCALGYTDADFDINKTDVSFKSEKGNITVCKSGAGLDFSEETAKEILLCDEIEINVDLNSGKEKATAWGCDLTYDYVKINGDYRT